MTDSPPVRYERIGAAAVLTIDRPGRRNAVNGPTAELLAAGLATFEDDPAARVLVLTGAGGVSFSAGADLKDLASFAGREYLPGGPEGLTRVTASKPTIAAIDGWCVAGGCAADRRRNPTPAPDHRPRPGARSDPDRP